MQIRAASHSQALAVTGGFNHPEICWRGNTAGISKPGIWYDAFLLQGIKETRRVAVLDLILTNKGGECEAQGQPGLKRP